MVRLKLKISFKLLNFSLIVEILTEQLSGLFDGFLPANEDGSGSNDNGGGINIQGELSDVAVDVSSISKLSSKITFKNALFFSFLVCEVDGTYTCGVCSWSTLGCVFPIRWLLFLLLQAVWKLWRKVVQISHQKSKHQVHHSYSHFLALCFASSVSHRMRLCSYL